LFVGGDVVKRREFEENGAKWAEVEYIVPGGVRVRVYREIRPKADLNHERAKPLVPRSLRRLLEKQEHLDKQEHLGLLNETGRLLLNEERRRGGPQRPKKPPKWWILDELWKLYRRNNQRRALDGSLWRWIAAEVTYRAREEGWLGENEELTVNRVKNTWRETGRRWKGPG